MFKELQTSLIIALGILMVLYLVIDPLLFEMPAKDGMNHVAVSGVYSFEMSGSAFRFTSYPNYWLFGTYIAALAVLPAALLTYTRYAIQFRLLLLLSFILMAYGVEVFLTIWVYLEKYYPSNRYEIFIRKEILGPLIMGLVSGLIGYYVYKKKSVES
jgi:hypothetical protein